MHAIPNCHNRKKIRAVLNDGTVRLIHGRNLSDGTSHQPVGSGDSAWVLSERVRKMKWLSRKWVHPTTMKFSESVSQHDR